MGGLQLEKPICDHIIFMGDSLSDRGTMNKRTLFGCIPMSVLSGLHNTSPQGRFTNGLAWSDHLAAVIANRLLLKQLADKWGMCDEDISEAIITGRRDILKYINRLYTLDDDKHVRYQNKIWLRSYCEGGLSAHNYQWVPTINPVTLFSRAILSNLAQKRNLLLQDDLRYFKEAKAHTCQEMSKKSTLVIEWSGANDLITVNERPSVEIAEKAIKDRIQNISILLAHGYRHFILFNMPDLSLTPRYQAKSVEERVNASLCCEHYNCTLQAAVAKFQQAQPECKIEIYNVYEQFSQVYQHPEKYQFERDKLTTPYTKSKDFIAPHDGISPSQGYMFYDDVHPTADFHAAQSYHFYDFLAERYELLRPGQTSKRAEKALGNLGQFGQHHAGLSRREFEEISAKLYPIL